MDAIRRNAHLAAALSPERVRDESEKILKSPHPAILTVVLELGLLDAYVTNPTASPRLLARLAEVQDQKQLLWAAFAAILAESDAIPSPQGFLRALRLDNQTVHTAGTAADIASDLPVHPVPFKHLLARYGLEIVSLSARAAEVFGHPKPESVLQEILRSGDCYSMAGLAIRGDDLPALGIAPGPQVGEVLRRLLSHVIQHPDANNYDTLCTLARRMKSK